MEKLEAENSKLKERLSVAEDFIDRLYFHIKDEYVSKLRERGLTGELNPLSYFSKPKQKRWTS